MLDIKEFETLPLRRIAVTSLKVALVVGTVLNVINQHQVILLAEPINWTQALLTYCVPFFVSSYGAVVALRGKAQRVGERASPADENW